MPGTGDKLVGYPHKHPAVPGIPAPNMKCTPARPAGCSFPRLSGIMVAKALTRTVCECDRATAV